ncbi:MAG: HAMP domain-containing sensor histidine kinase [Solirubrobacteraceae bacterium]
MLLTRLRWSAFGLRGRIVGAVIGTTAVTLVVASVVLLPRLEGSLTKASESTLRHDVYANRASIYSIRDIDYQLIVEATKGSALQRQGHAQSVALESTLKDLQLKLGPAGFVTLIGDVDASGYGVPIAPSGIAVTAGDTSDVTHAYLTGRTVISLGSVSGQQVVRAAIPIPGADAVLAVRTSIGAVRDSVAAVRHAFEVAAVVAIVLTMGIAIPLAGQLVSRLQRLRQAALELAMGGTVRDFPADRARDEVGDLARSFAIMQQRLRQQEQARRAFVATASHELRTPLASLNGMLELLADDLDADRVDLTDAQALLSRARSQSQRLAQLAADLLDLSRIDAEVTLRSEPIELGELSRAVVAEFELASGGRGVGLMLDDPGRQVWVLADPGSVARILRILLDNALRVAPSGTDVRVLVRPGPDPMLVVSDQGPGVAAQERTLIFERFKRGRETGGEAGFGLGLAIGRELAERMGGSLVLAATDGPGATFVLRLRPAAAPSAGTVSGAAAV